LPKGWNNSAPPTSQVCTKRCEINWKPN